MQAIDWKRIPATTSPALYHRMKQEILYLRDSGLVPIRLTELKQRMEMTLRGENFELAELEAVVSLLARPGMIQRLDFGGFILLRPEVLSRYAAAVVRKVRKHPQEMGCIREDELLAGDLDYQDFKRLPREDEAVVLRTLLETLISRAWCLRQACDGLAMLTFRNLMQHAQNVARLRRYFCGDKKCDAFGQAFGDQAKIAKALAPGGKGKVFCPDCGKPIVLRDGIEEKSDQEPALGGLLAAAGLRRHAGHPHVGWRNPLDGRERLPQRKRASHPVRRLLQVRACPTRRRPHPAREPALRRRPRAWPGSTTCAR